MPRSGSNSAPVSRSRHHPYTADVTRDRPGPDCGNSRADTVHRTRAGSPEVYCPHVREDTRAAGATGSSCQQWAAPDPATVQPPPCGVSKADCRFGGDGRRRAGQCHSERWSHRLPPGDQSRLPRELRHRTRQPRRLQASPSTPGLGMPSNLDQCSACISCPDPVPERRSERIVSPQTGGRSGEAHTADPLVRYGKRKNFATDVFSGVYDSAEVFRALVRESSGRAVTVTERYSITHASRTPPSPYTFHTRPSPLHTTLMPHPRRPARPCVAVNDALVPREVPSRFRPAA